MNRMAWQIIGHDWAVQLLQHSLATRRMAHAFLFSGPPHIGKTSLALAWAQALNCARADAPCGHCPSCLKAAKNAHPDIQTIVGQGAGGSIGIEQVRALQREAVLAPYEGRYRVFILEEMDRASTQAANSLLKTLEEPPRHVILVLTAVNPTVLPDTVVSRCQQLNLRPVASNVIEKTLLNEGVMAAQASLLARLSGGRLGWALDAARDQALWHQRQQDLDQLQDLLAEDRLTRLDFASRASRDPATVRRQVEVWTAWWRDLLLLCSPDPCTAQDCQAKVRAHVVNIDRMDELLAKARRITILKACKVLRLLQTTADRLDANVSTQLALEGLMLKLPS